MEGVQIGRIVHYVIPKSEEMPAVLSADTLDAFLQSFEPRYRAGDHAAAIIVGLGEPGFVNLSVFLNGGQVLYVESVPYSDNAAKNSWHWPERV